MDTINKNDLNDFTDDVKAYVNVRLQIIRLNVTEKVAFTLSNFISNGIYFVALTFFILFLSIGIALALGIYLKNNALGFIIVAGFYLFLVLAIRFIFSKGLKAKLANYFVKDLTNDDDETD